MDSIEKRIEKLKLDKQKVDNNISKLKKKSANISSDIESLQNQQILSIVKSSGCSIDDLVTTISILKSDNKNEANQKTEEKNEN